MVLTSDDETCTHKRQEVGLLLIVIHCYMNSLESKNKVNIDYPLYRLYLENQLNKKIKMVKHDFVVELSLVNLISQCESIHEITA